jgi:hypothetical protein
MRKSVVAAVALVGATALSGAAVLPGTAALPRTATADSSKSDAAAVTFTKRFVLHEIRSHGLGRFTFAGADKVMARRSGEVVGFDSFTGRFFPSQNRVVIDVGVALKGGVIVGRVHASGDVDTFQGPILKGTGKYKDIRGTISGRSASGRRTFVTLVYRL